VRRRDNKPVSLRRDPFARMTLERTRCEAGKTCRECGQPARFHYGWRSDGGGGGVMSFCGVDCFETYCRP